MAKAMGNRTVSGAPKLVILTQGSSDATGQEGKPDRFETMADSLGAGGIKATHESIRTQEELRHIVCRDAPDMVFPSFFRLHADSEDVLYLREKLINDRVAWVGSRSETLELALSKPRIKALWRLYGISTPEWTVIRKNNDGSIEGLESIEGLRAFPYIVKPAHEGNSRGIDASWVVYSPIELYARATLIAEEYGEALIERFVGGKSDSREFTVALIGNGSNSIISAVEILKKHEGSLIVTEADKKNHNTLAVPIEDARLRERIERLAKRVFVSADVRDYARCDILLHEGRLYALELNGQPMIPDLWFEACASAAGLDSMQYLNAIILAAIVGNARTGHAFIPIPRAMERVLPQLAYERLVG
jgi:D-alanine-D-alanine ligase